MYAHANYKKHANNMFIFAMLIFHGFQFEFLNDKYSQIVKSEQ
jgi:hypothetical protein